ncbi:MAG: YHS domain-containing protein [Candidatus Aminicenantes bacterium]|nr:YHS domain-containing protein [Candidatus Aminicenantes bacterium]TFG57748.1 MAG: YHS domain-containing protein [Candidatus Aminicenantes bacterium]
MNKNMRSIMIMAALAFVLVIAAVGQQKSGDTAIDPVCGMTVVRATAKATYDYKGTTYYFCNPGCKDAFVKEPEKYLKSQAKSEDKAIDPVCGMTVVKATAKATYEYKGNTFYFCSTGCKEAFAKDPEKYLKAGAKGEEKAAPMGMMHGAHMGQAPIEVEGVPLTGCPMMARRMPMRGRMGRMGMMHGGKGMRMGGGMGMGMACGPDCPLHGADVEMTVEKTKDGVTLKVTSKNAETVKAIQEHMTEHVAMMKNMKGEAGKTPEAAGGCANCAMKKDVIK